MPRPPLQQQSIYTVSTWESVRSVDNIVSEAEQGYFYNAALLVDQILRDDRIYGTLMTRVLGLLGKPLEFEPAKDTARGRNVAEEIEEDWPTLFGHAAVVDLLTWGIMLGVGLGQIIEDKKHGWYLEVWHPWALEWDPHERCYLVQGKGQTRVRLSSDGDGGYIDDAGRRWVIYTPYGFGNAGRRGLLRNLARLYLERQWAHRDRARYSEVHGQPMRVGIAPANATTAQVESFSDALSPVGGEPVVIVRQGEEGNKWDAKLVEATGKSHELFAQEIAQLDKAIATLVLGQSQSTDGQAGLGSNAEAGEPIRIDIMRADADTLSDALRAQLLVPYCDFTYGDSLMTPWPCWQVEPPEDQAYLATVHMNQATADNTYIQAGVLTPEEVALSRFGEGKYSLDTKIETATREKILEISAQQMEVEAEKALEDAKNPPEPVIAPNGAPNGVAVPQTGTQANVDSPSA
jgi:phage gp29-like protein